MEANNITFGALLTKMVELLKRLGHLHAAVRRSTKIETVVEPNSVLNDRWWESVALIDIFHPDMLPEYRLTCQYPLQSFRPPNVVRKLA